uniref:ABC-2 type transporter transmembrane domain-containing protein n=1 Tax=Catagonus wagneri TaxID=51154 RepID=A0A8C3VW42_9CETA
MDLLLINTILSLLQERKVVSLTVEISLTFLFSALILLHRRDSAKDYQSATHFSPLPLNELPSFLTVRNREYLLVYVPSESDVARNITEMVKNDLNASLQVRGFSSEEDFERNIMFLNKTTRVLAAIIFDHDFKNSNERLPLKVKYRLRFSSFNSSPDKLSGNSGWNTGLLFPVVPSQGPRNRAQKDGGYPGYYKEGFLLVQHALDKAIMMYHNGRAAEMLFENLTIFVRRFSYPAHYSDTFMGIFGAIFPLAVILIFSLTELTLLRTIVMEKENRLKEYQLMIGLNNAMLWASYFVTFFLMFLIIVCLMCMVLFVKIVPERVLQYSDPSLVFIFFLCFITASITFGFLITTFFSKSESFRKRFSLKYFQLVAIMYEQLNLTEKLVSCLSSNIAVALGIDFISKMEMKWNNLLSPVNPDDSFIFAHIMGMLLFDAFLYGLLAWYIDAVFPGKYGVPKPWYFFLQVSSNVSVIEKKNLEDIYQII